MDTAADAFSGKDAMSKASEGKDFCRQNGVLSCFFNKVTLCLRGELFCNDEHLSFVFCILLSDDLFHAEGGLARASSADDEPQSHLIPFFLLVFIYYSIKNEKEE